MTNTKDRVAAWLNTQRGVFNAVPVTVTIEGRSWDGAIYERWIGNSGVSMMYLVGEAPKNDPEEDPISYQIAGDDHEWFFAGCTDNCQILPENKKWHPFGAHWNMKPWLLGGKIDEVFGRHGRKYNLFPCRKVEARVER